MRVSEAEKKYLRKQAGIVGICLSEYIVKVGVQQRLYHLPSKLTKEFSSELSRIGNNINQIAYHLNKGHVPSQIHEKILGQIVAGLKALSEKVS